jgi:hypothetical protein
MFYAKQQVARTPPSRPRQAPKPDIRNEQARNEIDMSRM